MYIYIYMYHHHDSPSPSPNSTPMPPGAPSPPSFFVPTSPVILGPFPASPEPSARSSYNHQLSTPWTQAGFPAPPPSGERGRIRDKQDTDTQTHRVRRKEDTKKRTKNTRRGIKDSRTARPGFASIYFVSIICLLNPDHPRE